ncbi:MAG: TonB-dependent receptor [Cyclobacteriaceae bacterium]
MIQFLSSTLSRSLMVSVTLLYSTFLIGQDLTVSGIVTDQNNEPLPGVTILVPRTTNGTITDFDGNYKLKISEGDKLEYRFIGFLTQTVEVNGRTKIDVSLEEDVVQMDEVVVIGYGTVDKKDLTGSVSILSEDDLALQPVVRLEAALQSKLPGVVVNQNSGNPGSEVKVRIRGANSFGAGNGPLYVVDGYVGADIQSLNPDDVASISVLKDASASAIYGAQGANGVIIITTKNNKKDKTQISVKYQKSFSELRTRWDLMEGWQYMQTVNDRLRAGGTSEDNLLFSRLDILQAQSEGTTTDWQDAIFQTGQQDQIQVSVNKGSSVLSLAAQQNTGIITGTKYNRYNLRYNYSADIFEPVKLFLSISNAFEDRENSNNGEHINAIRAAVGWPTNLPIFDEVTGDYTRNAAYGPLPGNPVFMLKENPNRSFRNDLITNTFLEFKLAKGLKFKTQGIINLRGISSTSFDRVSPNIIASNPNASSYGNNNRMFFNWQATQQLSYKKTIGKHAFDATGIYEVRSSVERGFNSSGSELTTTALGYYSAGVADIRLNGASRENLEIWSYFGRVNYTFNGKYLFTFNARHDESSRLGTGYEGANFYGGAFAYRLSEEAFFPKGGAIDELKLRLSIGQLGSQAVDFLETIEVVNYNKGYSFDGSTFTRGAAVSRPKNERLGWETTNQVDAGIDLSLFDNRVNFTFDAFYKKTTNLIFNQLVPAYVGGGSLKVNSGEMLNKGIELAVSGYAIDKKDFSIEVNANVSVVRNELLDILGDADFIVSGPNQRDNPDLLDNTHRNFIGRPMGLLWGLVYDGVYSTDQEDLARQYNRSPGDPIYRDLNEDGRIDNTDMTVIGNPNPDFVWGLVTNFRYKKFTLNLVWNGVHGVDVLNSLKASTYGGAGNRDATNLDVLDRWTPDNQSSNIPGYTTTSVLYRQSSQWIEDGSYVKLRNATLKYDVPVKKLSWLKGVSDLSLFLTAQNALVFTKYTGYDPESLSNTGDKAGGFDEGGYPIPRTLLTGINITF